MFWKIPGKWRNIVSTIQVSFSSMTQTSLSLLPRGPLLFREYLLFNFCFLIEFVEIIHDNWNREWDTEHPADGASCNIQTPLHFPSVILVFFRLTWSHKFSKPCCGGDVPVSHWGHGDDCPVKCLQWSKVMNGEIEKPIRGQVINWIGSLLMNYNRRRSMDYAVNTWGMDMNMVPGSSFSPT